jgi:transposase
MQWVSGVERDASRKLVVQVQDLDGRRCQSDLKSLSADLAAPLARKQRRSTLSLALRREGDIRWYLAGIGCKDLETSGQRVYEFDSSIGVMVIPSQLLTIATLGSQQQVRSELFSPEGPEALMAVTVEDGKVTTALKPNRARCVDIYAPMIAVRLEWVLTYPSARAAWGSVYRNALDGRLDSVPVQGTADVLTHAVEVDGKLLVTSLNVLEVRPDEEPLPFAQGFAPKRFVFDTRRFMKPPVMAGRARATTGDDSLCALPSSGELTDEQWLAIEPFFTSKSGEPESARAVASRKYAVRDLADVMVHKMRTRLAWSKVPFDPKQVHSAIFLFYRLKNSGAWANVAATLSAHEARNTVS